LASSVPEFRTVQSDSGVGVIYECGCPCAPTAVPGDSEAGFEHCCCGKLHFAGPGAEEQLTRYLAARPVRKREPT
jgi:hypothetical protein